MFALELIQFDGAIAFSTKNQVVLRVIQWDYSYVLCFEFYMKLLIRIVILHIVCRLESSLFILIVLPLLSLGLTNV
jgi:hypothetical protein